MKGEAVTCEHFFSHSSPTHFLLDIPSSNSSSSPSSKELPYDLVQFTLVDCPGHASLIRTVIGGAQIIDSMILVVDVTKGIQAQTAECLVIGEILSDDMIVVMNKVDLVPHSERASYVERRRKEIRACLTDTKFADSPIIAVAAAVGGEESVGQVLQPVSLGFSSHSRCHNGFSLLLYLYSLQRECEGVRRARRRLIVRHPLTGSTI